MQRARALCCAAIAAVSAAAAAQPARISGGVVRIGVLTDLSGFLSDFTGPGAVTAVKMAVEDFGGKVLDKPIEVLAGDNLNKPDVASTVARSWFDTQQVAIAAGQPITQDTSTLENPAVLEQLAEKM